MSHVDIKLADTHVLPTRRLREIRDDPVARLAESRHRTHRSCLGFIPRELDRNGTYRSPGVGVCF
jgi:hypothetical protein